MHFALGAESGEVHDGPQFLRGCLFHSLRPPLSSPEEVLPPVQISVTVIVEPSIVPEESYACAPGAR